MPRRLELGVLGLPRRLMLRQVVQQVRRQPRGAQLLPHLVQLRALSIEVALQLRLLHQFNPIRLAFEQIFFIIVSRAIILPLCSRRS